MVRAGGGIYYATDNANELQFEIVGYPFYSTQTAQSSATAPSCASPGCSRPLASERPLIHSLSISKTARRISPSGRSMSSIRLAGITSWNSGMREIRVRSFHKGTT